MANWEPNNERLTGLADQLPTDGQVRRLLMRREVDDATERIWATGSRPTEAEEVAAPSGRETAASRPGNEVSPREREDDARRDEHEFGVQEFVDQEARDRQLLGRDSETWTDR